jgi:hypothetical protein
MELNFNLLRKNNLKLTFEENTWECVKNTFNSLGSYNFDSYKFLCEIKTIDINTTTPADFKGKIIFGLHRLR